MKSLLPSVVVATLAAGAAQAGTITGNIPVSGAADADRTVVYVEFASRPSGGSSRAKLLQKGARFNPTVLPVVTGTDVDMTNDDWVAHNVFSKSEVKSFDLGMYPPGTAKAVNFERPGAVDVFCAIHPRMSAVVLVLQNPYFTKPDSQGEFMIQDVPAGSYSLRVYRLGAPPVQKHIRVPDEGAAIVQF
jgi:plastocyanin